MASLSKADGTDQGYKFSNGTPLSPDAIDSSVSELFSNPWETIPSTPAIKNIIDENERLRGEVETLKFALEREKEELAARDKKIYELEKLVPWRDFKITMLEEILEVVKANRDCYKEKFEEVEQKLEKVEPLVEVGKATRWRNWEDKLSKVRRAEDIDVTPEEDYDVFDRIGLGEAGNHAAHWINLRADLALFDTIIDSRIKEIRAQEFERINHISIDLARRSVEILPKGLMEAKSMRIEVDFLTHMDDEFLTPYQDALKNSSEEHEALFKSLLEMNNTRSRSEFDTCLEVKHNLYQMRCITENMLRTRKKIRRNASRRPVTVR